MLKKILMFGAGTLFGIYTTICTVISIMSLKSFCSAKIELDELKNSETKKNPK